MFIEFIKTYNFKLAFLKILESYEIQSLQLGF